MIAGFSPYHWNGKRHTFSFPFHPLHQWHVTADTAHMENSLLVLISIWNAKTHEIFLTFRKWSDLWFHQKFSTSITKLVRRNIRCYIFSLLKQLISNIKRRLNKRISLMLCSLGNLSVLKCTAFIWRLIKFATCLYKRV